MFFSAPECERVTKTFDGPVEKPRKGLCKKGMKDTLSHLERDRVRGKQPSRSGLKSASARHHPNPLPRGEGTTTLQPVQTIQPGDLIGLGEGRIVEDRVAKVL